MGQACEPQNFPDPDCCAFANAGVPDYYAEVDVFSSDYPAPACPAAALILSSEDVQNQQQAMIADTAEELGVSRDDATMLLISKTWCHDSLCEEYYADRLNTLNIAGVVSERVGSLDDENEKSLCKLCTSASRQDLLGCGHGLYCSPCWKRFAVSAVKGGKSCLSLRCPSAGCSAMLRPSDFRSLCSPSQLIQYERYLFESFVAGNNLYAWCPNPSCTRISRAPQGAKASVVRCLCGTEWCVKCKCETHHPVQCALARAWNKEAKDMQCCAVSSKPCPKCQKSVEKTGGCKRTTCSIRTGCGHSFCWLCLDDWNTHSPESGINIACNKFDPDLSGNIQVGEARFQHYSQRFFDHQRSQEYVHDTQRAVIRELASNLVLKGFIPIQTTQFLHDTLNELALQRQYLKWTYVYAYYTDFQPRERLLFFRQQSQCEGCLEKLSCALENTEWKLYYGINRNASVEQFMTLRTQINDWVQILKRSFSTLDRKIGSL